jgi:hypothetical protein
MRVTRALSTLRSKWNSSNKDQRCFFGFCIFSVCFTTNDFTRSNSFRHPFAKSRGPYSNRTTKQKARTTNRTSQKSPRNKAMNERLSCSTRTVNAARGPSSPQRASGGQASLSASIKRTGAAQRVRPVADEMLVGRDRLEVYLP